MNKTTAVIEELFVLLCRLCVSKKKTPMNISRSWACGSRSSGLSDTLVKVGQITIDSSSLLQRSGSFSDERKDNKSPFKALHLELGGREEGPPSLPSVWTLNFFFSNDR